MGVIEPNRIRAAEVVLHCGELDETLAFFTGTLGFRVATISPADDPRVAVVAGHGLRVRLERGAGGAPGVLRLTCRDAASLLDGARELTAPNGTRILLVEERAALVLPPLVPSLVVNRAGGAESWNAGRAGMLYRDLVPDRQGGRFIASHIRIPQGGPVPDWVHYHRVRFQMIYCRAGDVRVVYEDQGPPFVLAPGDCVLQPPEIRHRVLECSSGLEVVEVSCPAEHDTFADPELELPTQRVAPERDFGGQRFVRHVAASAEWGDSRVEGFEARDLGIAAASGGLAGARVLRARGPHTGRPQRHDGELLFTFVLDGSLALRVDGRSESLGPGDSFVVPTAMEYAFAECSDDLELLEVRLPAGAGESKHQ